MDRYPTSRLSRLLQVLIALSMLLTLVSPAIAAPKAVLAGQHTAAAPALSEGFTLPQDGRPLSLRLGAPEENLAEGDDDSHEPFVEPPPPEPILPERPPVTVELSASPRRRSRATWSP